MGQAIIFFLVLALTAPLTGGIFTAIRTVYQFIQGITGFRLMFEVISVMDCCLPFSLVQLLTTLSLAGSAIGAFLIARKVASIILGLFSPHL